METLLFIRLWPSSTFFGLFYEPQQGRYVLIIHSGGDLILLDNQPFGNLKLKETLIVYILGKDLFIKNRSKHSSNTLLCLLRFFMNKSLLTSIFQSVPPKVFARGA